MGQPLTTLTSRNRTAVHGEAATPALPILLIGASTGGPQALEAVLVRLGPSLAQMAVVVVLHMPAAFVEIVAQHVARLTGRPTQVGGRGDVLECGRIYIAPGDVHLELVGPPHRPHLAYSHAPPVNFCRPSVDVLFGSAAQTIGAHALAVVLTGMGRDGVEGARAIVSAGGRVLVQDQATSVVWGMPGAVAAAGLAHAVLPLDLLAIRIRDLLRPSVSRRDAR